MYLSDCIVIFGLRKLMWHFDKKWFQNFLVYPRAIKHDNRRSDNPQKMKVSSWENHRTSWENHLAMFDVINYGLPKVLLDWAGGSCPELASIRKVKIKVFLRWCYLTKTSFSRTKGSMCKQQAWQEAASAGRCNFMYIMCVVATAP